MRDPLDLTNRAYEVLGLPRDATPAQVNAAYATLAQSSRILPPELKAAFYRLRKPESRFSEDFWFYPAGDDASVALAGLGAGNARPHTPALVPIGEGIRNELLSEAYRADFCMITFRRTPLVHLDQYGDPPLATVDVTFPR